MVMAVLLVSAGFSGVTYAQPENSTGNETAPEEPTVIRADLGNGVTLVDFEKTSGALVFILEAELPRTLLTWQDTTGAQLAADRKSGRSGLAAVNMENYQEQVWLDEGRNRVVLDATERGGSATVSIWTSGGPTFVISEPLGNRNPLESFGGTQGVFAGSGTAVMAALVAAGWIMRKESGEVIKA